MKRFEYDITKHPADAFRHAIYFWPDHSDCNLNGVSCGELEGLGDLLNDKGSEGWQRVQIFMGEDGVVAFWNKESELAPN